MSSSSSQRSGFDEWSLVERLRRFRDARGWSQFHTAGHLAVAIAVEASELLEHFLWVNDSDADAAAVSNREALAEELADVLIYLIYLADRLGIDLWEAAERKVDRNENRFPVDTG
jgi:NTP pyrophosphatase (non-canonical NTP hydrolase)